MLALLSAVFNRILSFANLSDVHFDIPLKRLLSIGCSECEDSGLTASGNLTSCSGPYFFFGAKSCSSEIFDIGSYALEEEVNKETLFDAPFIFEGTVLPLHSDLSSKSDLAQRDRSSDNVVGDTDNHASQGMLPHFDEGASKEDLNNDVSQFRNFIYTCPTGILSPSYRMLWRIFYFVFLRDNLIPLSLLLFCSALVTLRGDDCRRASRPGEYA